jgi:50S ribosomal protein L16 3-hydroxylase
MSAVRAIPTACHAKPRTPNPRAPARHTRAPVSRACASSSLREGVVAIDELHAQLPFDRDTWKMFMSEYWQKRPCVIRGAVNSTIPEIDADELSGLACENVFQPRIIRKGEGRSDWALEMGPFSEDELRALPTAGSWCLIMNDLEKHIREVKGLLALFDHFPRWRVADVQASLSADGGSVGPHSDQFDVFLIQAEGNKAWSISDSAEYAPDNESAFYQDIDVRVLKDFRPTSSSLLERGDMLYLPPKVAHHGVAKGCDTVCVTYSVGFLAPTHDELVSSFAQASVNERAAVERWSDPWLEPQCDVGKISAAAVTHATEIIRNAMPKNETDVARWFGCHVTGSGGVDDAFFAPVDDVTADELIAEWTETGFLFRRGDIKFAIIEDVSDGSLDGCLFFAAGSVWTVKSPRCIVTSRTMTK